MTDREITITYPILPYDYNLEIEIETTKDIVEQYADEQQD